ncbi:MAG: glycerol-3-phosphate acyltransferase [Patescibacteria group bacterium]
MEMILYAILFILCYLIGSFPTAYLLVKKVMGKDIRKFETGNVGAMNTARITGKFQYFLIVFIVDALKGVLSMYVAWLLHTQYALDYNVAFAIAAFAAVLGHCYSFYFLIKDGKFSGGKAISTMAGVLICLSLFKLFLPTLLFMGAVIFFTRNLFASQFFAAFFVPALTLVVAPQYFLLTVLCAIPVLMKQSSRIIPFFKGEEPKLYWGKKAKSSS